ncbi:MAG: MFS transporter [Chloroflexota bacterium]
MWLIHFLKTHNWNALAGYLLFVGMMAIGYYYNLTFVQFGLLDLGTRLVGMTREQVAVQMTFLAVITCAVALTVGWVMMRRGWSQRFEIKLRLAFAVVLLQTALTAAAPFIRSEASFFIWIVVASLALGVGVPATFGMTVDLIPVGDRGLAAALITAGAYFPAAVFSGVWTIETLSAQMLLVMAPGAVALGLLAFGPWSLTASLTRSLAQQHRETAFGMGRFVRVSPTGKTHVSRYLLGLILLMFAIYFIDSLGFLRLADTPFFFEVAWQSPDLAPRLLIGLTHIAGALIAGALYTAMGERQLFLWIFGLFAMVHLLGIGTSLGMPILYALAVSLYTVVNFAIWADISTPHTITRNTAAGVALSGWAATFLSTALSLQLAEMGVTLETHLQLVDAVAMLFFLLVLALLYFNPSQQEQALTET